MLKCYGVDTPLLMEFYVKIDPCLWYGARTKKMTLAYGMELWQCLSSVVVNNSCLGTKHPYPLHKDSAPHPTPGGNKMIMLIA